MVRLQNHLQYFVFVLLISFLLCGDYFLTSTPSSSAGAGDMINGLNLVIGGGAINCSAISGLNGFSSVKGFKLSYCCNLGVACGVACGVAWAESPAKSSSLFPLINGESWGYFA